MNELLQGPLRNECLSAQLRNVEKIDFWLTFDHQDVQRLMLEAANEIERLWTENEAARVLITEVLHDYEATVDWLEAKGVNPVVVRNIRRLLEGAK